MRAETTSRSSRDSFGGFEAQRHIFGYGDVVDQHEMLVDHADAIIDRIGGRIDRDRLRH